MRRAGWLIPLSFAVAVGSWLLLEFASGPEVPAPTSKGFGTATLSDEDAAATLKGTGRQGVDEAAPVLRLGRDVIRVRVVDRNGQPVSGTPVRLSGPLRLPPRSDLSPLQQLRRRTARWGFQPYSEVRQHLSDERGIVRFEELQNHGSWRVTAVPPAPLCVVSRAVPRTFGGEGVIELVLLEGVPLDVRLVDGGGAGLSGFVEVTAPVQGRRHAPRWTTAPLKTDAEGLACVRVPPGVCSVRATVPGVGVRSGLALEAPYAGVYRIAFVASDPAEIFGRVLHPDGTSVAGASLWVRTSASGEDAFASDHEARSDGSGRYRITGVAGTRIVSFVVRADGHVTRHRIYEQCVIPRGGRLELDVLLPRGCVVEGQVVDPAGQPLVGATVQVSLRLNTPWDWFLPVVATDAGGKFRFVGVPPGHGQLIVRMPGYQRGTAAGPPTYAVPEPGDRQEVLVVLLPGAEVRGVVLDPEGRPAVGATVALGRSFPGGDWFAFSSFDGSTTTDREGRYVLTGFDPDAALFLRASTDAAWSEDVPVPKGPPAGGVVVDLALRPGARIAGRVLQGSEVPQPPRVLRLTMGTNGRFWRQVSTDTEGRFTFQGLPQGQAIVVIQGLDSILPSSLLGAARRDVALVWGQEAESLAFDLPRLGRLGGTVRDAAGAPLVGVAITLVPEDEAGSHRRYCTSGLGGAFQFRDLPDVPYRLSVSGREHGTVHIGEQGLEVEGIRETMPQGWIRQDLRGRVLLPGGRLLPSGTCTLFDVEDGSRIGQVPVRDGLFTIPSHGTRPERVRVQIDDPADLFGNPVNVLPGALDLAFPAQGLLEVHLKEGRIVAGRLVTEDGQRFVPSIVNLRLTPLPAPPGGKPPAIETIMLSPDLSEARFSFVGLPTGRWTLEVVAAGSAYTAPPAREVESDDGDLEIRLRRGLSIKGRLLAPDGGGVEGGTIIFNETDPPGRVAFAGYARSGEEGRFEIRGVPAGTTGRLWGAPVPADAERMVAAQQHDVRSGASGIMLQLQMGTFISGRIDMSAAPGRVLDQVMVTAWPTGAGAARSFNGKGPAFRIGPMLAGVYELEVHPGREFPRQKRVEVRAPARDVVLAIEGGVRVEGELLTSDPGRFRLSWQWRGGGREQELQFATAQADGRFVLWVPEDAVPGTLFARNPETGEMAVKIDVRPGDGPFPLTPAPGLTIRGRAVEERLGRCRIVARGPITAFGRTENDGNFEMTGLPAGRYDLSIGNGGRQAVREGVTAGSTGVLVGVASR